MAGKRLLGVPVSSSLGVPTVARFSLRSAWALVLAFSLLAVTGWVDRPAAADDTQESTSRFFPVAVDVFPESVSGKVPQSVDVAPDGLTGLITYTSANGGDVVVRLIDLVDVGRDVFLSLPSPSADRFYDVGFAQDGSEARIFLGRQVALTVNITAVHVVDLRRFELTEMIQPDRVIGDLWGVSGDGQWLLSGRGFGGGEEFRGFWDTDFEVRSVNSSQNVVTFGAQPNARSPWQASVFIDTKSERFYSGTRFIEEPPLLWVYDLKQPNSPGTATPTDPAWGDPAHIFDVSPSGNLAVVGFGRGSLDLFPPIDRIAFVDVSQRAVRGSFAIEPDFFLPHIVGFSPDEEFALVAFPGQTRLSVVAVDTGEAEFLENSEPILDGYSGDEHLLTYLANPLTGKTFVARWDKMYEIDWQARKAVLAQSLEFPGENLDRWPFLFFPQLLDVVSPSGETVRVHWSNTRLTESSAPRTISDTTFPPTVVFTRISVDKSVLQPGALIAVDTFTYSQDGSVAVAVDAEYYRAGTVVARKWDANSGQLSGQESFPNFGDLWRVNTILSPDGETAYLFEQDKITGLNLTQGTIQQFDSLSGAVARAAALTPDGQELLVALDGGAIESFDLATGQRSALVTTSVFSPRHVVVSGDTLVISDGEETVFYDRESKLPIGSLEVPWELSDEVFPSEQAFRLWDVVASASGSRLISLAQQVVMFDAAGEEISSFDYEFESRVSRMVVTGLVSFGEAPLNGEDQTMVTLDRWSVVEEAEGGAIWPAMEETFAASAALSPTGRFAFVGLGKTITAYSLDELSAVDEFFLDSSLLTGSRIVELVMNPGGTSLAVVVEDPTNRWVTLVDLPESLWDQPEPKESAEGDESARIAGSGNDGAISLPWLVGGLIAGASVIAVAIALFAVKRRRGNTSTP